MKRWFSAQPIHRKLVLTSMAKTTAVLATAMLVLLAVDAWRFHQAAKADADTLARFLSENVRSALTFDMVQDVDATLTLLRLRPQVQRACVYDEGGGLVASYVRAVGQFRCPDQPPAAGGAFALEAFTAVENGGTRVGLIYLERDWAFLWDRMTTAGVTSLVVLVLAAGVMLMLSNRLHRHISEPIGQLAMAARRMGQADDFAMPRIAAPPDEVGQLVSAFTSMVERVRGASQELSQSNDALRREIEERRAIEIEREALLLREQEANRLKDEFLATVSHELRTPLNAIVGWASILATAKPDAATVERAAASLHRNAQMQARVIDDLIDISRIVTGKLRVMLEPLDLRPVVESAVDAIRPVASHAGVTLDVAMPDTPVVMQGDRDRLQQVAWNLLSNAVKFAPGGRVRVALEAAGADVALRVADDGIGIPSEFLSHVFDRFRQADASITRERGGLGIGLAVVKELVDLHRGTIEVASDGRGRGATFTARFPRFAGAVSAAAAEAGAPSLEGLSVMAVDDNLDSLELLRASLTRAGAEVRVAASGPEAVERWQERPSDVLLCDLAMPQMSGFELLGRIRDLDRQAGRMTPAIAVTAHATEEIVTRSAQAGFQMHIPKPFDPMRLVRAVSTVRVRV